MLFQQVVQKERVDTHMAAKKSPLEEVFALVVHVPVAIFGAVIFAIMLDWLASAIFPTVGIRRALSLGIVYNPFLWVFGMLLGLLVNRFTRHRSACWVGAVALLFMFAVMVWDISIFKRSGYYATLTHGHYWKYELGQLFSRNDASCSDSECLGKLFVTFPVVASIAYSIGAWLALRFRHN